ncbi:MAG: pre-peptidase C-terminal domain-containing protein [Polyangiaceae bacterium]|nr:pre-peptidase C-terminal domain-containing protein [Polyangiaceae bacterium]
MRARHFLALLAAGVAATVAIGCDGGDTGTGGTGGSGGSGGTGATGATTTSSTTTTTSTSTGTPTPTGDGNDSFDEAIETTVFQSGEQAELTVGELDPIATDQDYFKFTGVKGDALYITTLAKTAQGSPDPFAEGYPDLVITLYDSNKQQIAQNDDPIPRNTQDSSLYTVLPGDGTFYIKVEEFCQELGAAACDPAYFDGIVEPAYGFVVFKLDGATDGTVTEGTDTDMPQAIDAAEYVENTDGTGYFAISVQGTFKAADDEDVYTFTVPNAIPVTQGRETAYFEIYPTGTDGNGSDTPTGLVWIEDGMGNVLAQVDGTKLDPIDGYPLEVPLTFGTQQYELHVKSGGAAAAGGNNFYYVLHYRSGSNPVEAADATNNMQATPELLPTLQSGGGFDGGFIAGDINMAGDVDFYELEATPNAGDNVFATCSAQRIGSGLRNLKLTLIDGDTGMAIPTATATESATASASLGDMGAALGNTTKVLLKVEATQDAVVKGTYYQCGVVFIPPQ